MGSKNSVLKRNKTPSDQNRKNTIQNVFIKRNPVRTEKVHEDPLVPNCGEAEKAHENVSRCGKTPPKVHDNCTNSEILLKDNKVSDADLTICRNSISESRFRDEIIDDLKTPADKPECSKTCSQVIATDPTKDQNVKTLEPSSRSNLQIVLANNRDTSESQYGTEEEPQPPGSETDMSQVDVDPSNPFDLDDELYFLIGGNFNNYNHPIPKCLTPRLGDEILNDVGKNEPLVSVDVDFAKKGFLESTFGKRKNKMIEQFILDTAGSMSRTSNMVGPRSLNVAIVKGMIYKRELYGPPIDQPGRAGPSQPQVPIGTEEYVITKRFNYGKDDAQTADKKGFGCTCIESWGKDSMLNPLSKINQLPTFDQPLREVQKSSSAIKLKRKDSVKDKKVEQSKKRSKKTGSMTNVSAKKVISKKISSKKGTSKKMSSSAKAVSPLSQKETSGKIKGKTSKKVAKGAKKPTTKKASRTDLLSPSESVEDEIPSTSKPIKPKVVGVTPKVGGLTPKVGGLTPKVKPTVKQDIKNTNPPKSRSDTDLSKNANLKFNQNDNNYMFVNMEKCGPSNIRVGVSRTDQSGYDIMFKDDGDMKVKVEKIIAGKNRVFTYNSGNEAVLNDTQEKPIEVKTTQTLPTEENKKTSPPADSQNQAKKLIKIKVKVPKTLDTQKKLPKDRSTHNGEAKSNTFVPIPIREPQVYPRSSDPHHEPHSSHLNSSDANHESRFVHPSAPATHHESSFVHPSSPGTRNDKEDVAIKRDHRKKETNKSLDEYFKPRKISPSLVHESLQPIFEKIYPKDVGSLKDPNYIADVQTDKCIAEGNKIECLTSIPNFKVVFDVPDAHGKKIEPHTAKSKMAISQYDIHVDVGLDRMGPKYLEQISNKAGRYDSLASNENMIPKADIQNTVHKMEHAEDGRNKITKVPHYMQSMASLHSVESGITNADSSDKKNQQNEQNKFKSKLYDANKLLEIKECLSKMRLELRNECPCLSSRHQDKLENKDKNARTDRVIVIRTKRKEGGEDCSDESDSEEEKEKEDALAMLAKEILDEKINRDKRKDINSGKERNYEEGENSFEDRDSKKDNDQSKKQYDASDVNREYKNKLEKENQDSKNIYDDKAKRKSGRQTDDESLNHPELNEHHMKSSSKDEETYLETRGRRKKGHSDERGRSIWNHPESSVTEEEALLTKSILKGALNKKGSDKNMLMDDSHVLFKNASGDLSEVEMKPHILRHPTGIFYQGQNLLAGTTFDDDQRFSTDEVTESNAKKARKKGVEKKLRPFSSRDSDRTNDELSSEHPSDASSFIGQQVRTEAIQKTAYGIHYTESNSDSELNHHPKDTVTRQTDLTAKKRLDKKIPKMDSHVGFQNADIEEHESNEKRPSRIRRPTGFYLQGNDLLKATNSEHDSQSDDDTNYSENDICELTDSSGKNKNFARNDQSFKPIPTNSVRNTKDYIDDDSSSCLSAGSVQKGGQHVQNETINKKPYGITPSNNTNNDKSRSAMNHSKDTVTVKKELMTENTTGKKVLNKKRSNDDRPDAGVAVYNSDEQKHAVRNGQLTGRKYQGTTAYRSSSQTADVGYSDNNRLEPGTTNESTRNDGLHKIRKKNYYLSKLEESSEGLSDPSTIGKRSQPVRNEAIQKTSYRLRPINKNIENKGRLTTNNPDSTVKEHDPPMKKNMTKSPVDKEALDKMKSGAGAGGPPDGTHDASNHQKQEMDQINAQGSNKIRKKVPNEETSRLNSRKTKPNSDTTGTKTAPHSSGISKRNAEATESNGTRAQAKSDNSGLKKKSENENSSSRPKGKAEVMSSEHLDEVKSDAFTSWDSKTNSANLPTVCRLKPNVKDTFLHPSVSKGMLEFTQVKSDASDPSDSKIITKKNSTSSRLKANAIEPLHSSGVPKEKDEAYESTESLARVKSDALNPSASKISTNKRSTACRIKANAKDALRATALPNPKEEAYESTESLARVKSEALNPSDSKINSKKRSTACRLKANAKDALRATALPNPKEEAYKSADSLPRVKSDALNPSDSKISSKKRSTACRLKANAKDALRATGLPNAKEEAYKSTDSPARVKSDALNPSDTKINSNKRSTACRLKANAKDALRATSRPKGKEEKADANVSSSSLHYTDSDAVNLDRLEQIKEESLHSYGRPNRKADANLSSSSLDYSSSDAVNLSNLKTGNTKDRRIKKGKTDENKRKVMTAKHRKTSLEKYSDSGVPVGKVLADHRLEKTILTERLNNIINSLCIKCPPPGVAMRCCCSTARPARLIHCPPRFRKSPSPRK